METYAKHILEIVEFHESDIYCMPVNPGSILSREMTPAPDITPVVPIRPTGSDE
ncbi:MAG: hypothetical protein LUC95_09300 [Lachnospiraceae bacterium]|nr:hypothetical protein [Lachnospiraceae bacterium]